MPIPDWLYPYNHVTIPGSSQLRVIKFLAVTREQQEMCTKTIHYVVHFVLNFVYFSLRPCSPLGLGRFSSFLILYTVYRTPWTGDEPVLRSLPTHRTTQTQNKLRQTSMPRMGFEPTTPAFERAKTVHALDRATTVIGTSKRIVASIRSTLPIFFLVISSNIRILTF
jgi:hypothetical protein